MSTTTWWYMDDIAKAAGVELQTVWGWNSNTRKKIAKAEALGVRPKFGLTDLPEPEDYDYGTGRPRPKWRKETAQGWLQATGRMTETGEPRRLLPPGRPCAPVAVAA